jgi:hypothetical protein
MTFPTGATPAGEAVLAAESPTGAVALSIVDADFRPVAEGVGRVEATLAAPGIYEVVARAGPRTARRLVKLEAGERRTVDDLEVAFPAASPTAGTSTTHEYHMDLAHEATRPGLPAGADDGGLIVVLRDVRGQQGPPLTARDLSAVALLDGSLRRLDGLDALWVSRPADAAAYWRLPLRPGGYAIRQPTQRAAGERAFVDQSVWIQPGWQTIVFLLRSDPGARPAWPSIHLSPLTEGWQSFDPRFGTSYELALWELRNPGASRTLLDDGAIDATGDNPLLAIVAAAALLRRSPVDLGRVAQIIDQLAGRLPGHPDVAGLQAAARLAGAPVPAPRDVYWPPMLAELYLALLHLDADEPGTIAPGSPAEAIAARLVLSGIWTTWQPLDEAPAMAPAPPDAPDPDATLQRLDAEPARLAELQPAEPADRRVAAFLGSVADLAALDPDEASIGALGVRDVARATHLPDAVARESLRRLGASLPPPGDAEADGDDGDGGGDDGGGGGGGTITGGGLPLWAAIVGVAILLLMGVGVGIASGIVPWPPVVDPTPTPSPTATTGPTTAPSPTPTTAPTPTAVPTPPPVLSLDVPPVLEFDTTDVRTTLALPLAIVNDGTAPVTIRALTIQGANPQDFAVDPGTCVGTALQPGQGCEARVGFTPLAPGLREAELVVVADEVDKPPVALLGTGNEGTLLFDPPALDLTALSSQPVEGKVAMVASEGPVAIDDLAIDGPYSGEFRVTFTDCLGVMLEIGQGCSATIAYVPPAGSWTGLPQPRTADLNVVSSTGRRVPLPLVGRLNIVD